MYISHLSFNRIIVTVILLMVHFTFVGQNSLHVQDSILTKEFKAFQKLELDSALTQFPKLESIFIEAIQDSSSYINPFDSLKNCIQIEYSTDSIVKSYCWSDRDGGCCHSSVIYAQFRSEDGKIQFFNLEEDKPYFIKKIHHLKINNQNHYLIIGAGSCCGGKHYNVAKLYAIQGERLTKVAVINEKEDLIIEAMRGQEINLVYDAKSKTMSFIRYDYNEDTGYYNRKKTLVKLQLLNSGFKVL